MLANIRQYIFIVFLFLGAIAVLVYFSASDHLEDFEEYHASLARGATAHGKDVIELYLSNLRHAINVFARQHFRQIRALATEPYNQKRFTELELSLKHFFPDVHTFAIADSKGDVILEDKKGFIGKGCKQNIRLFALDSSKSESGLRMHFDMFDYHFDMMMPVLLKDGKPAIFFVTFRPDKLTRYLASAQPENHTMYIIKNDGSNQIELGVKGASIKPERDPVLSGKDMHRVRFRRHIKNTQWDIVDLIDTGMWQSEFRQVLMQSLIVFTLFVGGGFASLFKIASIENERKDTRQKLIEHEQELERTVHERTQALMKANERLEHLSLSDGLTGIANRRHFDAILNREIGRANRENKPLSLLLFDIDFFKNYNDCEGHLAGDDCLRKIAKAVDAEFKRGGDLTARYGGEEFAIILPGSDATEMQRQAERVREIIWNLNIPHPSSTVSDRVTVSVGGATLRRDQYKTANDLIDEADEALYQAKSGGRNKYRVYGG